MKTNQNEENALKSANRTLANKNKNMAKETTDSRKVIGELKIILKAATERETISQKIIEENRKEIEENRKEIEELKKKSDSFLRFYQKLQNVILEHNSLPFYKRFKKIKLYKISYERKGKTLQTNSELLSQRD